MDDDRGKSSGDGKRGVSTVTQFGLSFSSVSGRENVTTVDLWRDE